jgi:NAD-reducing hydrogenase small subunit
MTTTTTPTKARVATVWLDGCSGCHMSFLDMDERLIALADRIELVYSPLVDAKQFPPDVDVTLVEGAVATDEDEHKIRRIRARTKLLVSLGDCAVTGNVPSMRNPFSTDAVYDRAFLENVDLNPVRPSRHLPVLLEHVKPVHEVVKVDVFVPGCPPPADAIHFVVAELLAGRVPDVSAVTRFGK